MTPVAQEHEVARTHAPQDRLLIYRDDGPLAQGLGRLARGRVPPLPGALAALAATAALLALGAEWPVAALFAPVAALALMGPGAGHSHHGRLDWLVPPLTRAIEYGYLAVLGVAQGVSAPLVYVVLAVLAYHHYDIVYRIRQEHWPAERLALAGLGWEGRTLAVALFGAAGQLPFAYAALAAYLGVLFVGDSAATWTRPGPGRSGHGGATGDREEEQA